MATNFSILSFVMVTLLSGLSFAGATQTKISDVSKLSAILLEGELSTALGEVRAGPEEVFVSFQGSQFRIKWHDYYGEGLISIFEFSQNKQEKEIAYFNDSKSAKLVKSLRRVREMAFAKSEISNSPNEVKKINDILRLGLYVKGSPGNLFLSYKSNVFNIRWKFSVYGAEIEVFDQHGKIQASFFEDGPSIISIYLKDLISFRENGWNSSNEIVSCNAVFAN